MAGALVVFESVFDDAKLIALAIAEGLASRLSVDVVSARDAPTQVPSDVRILAVGAPSHDSGAPGTTPGRTFGLHDWLDRVQLPRAINAAAFDTRVDRPTLGPTLDHAAQTEQKLLRMLGATLAAPAEHFLVVASTGPLAEGEQDRARRWGQALGELVAARQVNGSS